MLTRDKIEKAAIIAECGSFSKAAERLYISPSALIQQINLVESEIGFSLFSRTKKGVHLTDAGCYYISQMQQIHERIDAVVEAARDIAANRKRNFRIGYLPGQSAKITIALCHELLIAFPDVSIKISPVMIDMVPKDLIAGRIDCCVVPHLKKLDGEQYDGFTISTTPLMVGICPELALAQKEALTFDDFRNKRIVLPERGRFETGDLFEDWLIERHIAFERITQNDHMMAEMTCFSEKACRINGTVVEGSPLVYRPLKEALVFSLYLVFCRGNYNLIREFVDFARGWADGQVDAANP